MPAARTDRRCIVRYAPGLFIRCDSLVQPLSCGTAVGPLCRSEGRVAPVAALNFSRHTALNFE